MTFNSKIFLSLTKSRLAISVVFSALAGYILAADNFNFLNIFLLLVGGYCIVGASNSFNQIIEKDKDSMMDRTKNRPLPKNHISKSKAFWISVFLTLVGLLCLLFYFGFEVGPYLNYVFGVAVFMVVLSTLIRLKNAIK